MNPIRKNESYRLPLLGSAPVVPDDTAVVLYPDDARDQCKVYLQEDTIFPAEIRRWRFNRLVHITLNPFEFQKTFRFAFSENINQWVEITYKFVVVVNSEKESIKVILKNNITDISVPVTDILDGHMGMILGERYSCLQSLALETAAYSKIKDIVSRIPYLKVLVYQASVKRDRVSDKIIADNEANELAKAELKKIEDDLARKKEEAEARMREAEIARVVAMKDEELAEIRRKRDLSEQEHEIEKRRKELAAEEAYGLQQESNAAAIAKAQKDNIDQHGLEALAAINPSYLKHIELQQSRTDRERENKEKDFDLQYKVIMAVKEAIGDADEATVSEVVKNILLSGNTMTQPLIGASKPAYEPEESRIIAVDLSEDGSSNV